MNNLKWISVNDIRFGNRIRKPDEASVSDLVSSIKEVGHITPISVRKIENGYKLIAGGRRWTAAKILNDAGEHPNDGMVPAIVLDFAHESTMNLAELLENTLRSNFSWQEEAVHTWRIYQELEAERSNEDISKLFGISRATLANLIKLGSVLDEDPDSNIGKCRTASEALAVFNAKVREKASAILRSRSQEERAKAMAEMKAPEQAAVQRAMREEYKTPQQKEPEQTAKTEPTKQTTQESTKPVQTAQSPKIQEATIRLDQRNIRLLNKDESVAELKFSEILKRGIVDQGVIPLMEAGGIHREDMVSTDVSKINIERWFWSGHKLFWDYLTKLSRDILGDDAKSLRKANLAKAKDSYVVGDFMEQAKQLIKEKQKFDLIECDPPYAIDLVGRRDDDKAVAIETYEEIPEDKYFQFIMDTVDPCEQLLKESGIMIFWFGVQHYEMVLKALKYKNGVSGKERNWSVAHIPFHWVAPSGTTNRPGQRLASCIDMAFVVMGKKAAFNKRGRPNWVVAPRVHTRRRWHLTQKPMTMYGQLFDTLIDLRIGDNYKALVPFAGSGTSIAVLSLFGVDTVGFDLSERHKSDFESALDGGYFASLEYGKTSFELEDL